MNKKIDLNEVFTEKTIKFRSVLLQFLSDYELKVLIFLMFSVNSKGIFKGNLARMCSWLKVKSSTTMNKNLKAAIQSLAEQGYISYSVKGKEWTFEIHESTSSNGSNIRKAWIKEILNYNRDAQGNKIRKDISISWIQIFKVFIFTLVNCNGELITSGSIADALDISRSTVCEAFNAIEQCHLDGLVFEKETQTTTYEKMTASGNFETKYKCLGSEVRYLLNAVEI